jgi:prepilin-type N-terminal cleavage/methylation domain-containing protein
VVSCRREKGYTLAEMVVSVAVFGVIVAIFSILAAEMRAHQARLPMNFMRHPQVSAVISRVRRDVQDSKGHYENNYDGYTAAPDVLIVETLHESGGVRMIVWDFREPGVARRRSYNVGVVTEWVARGLPASASFDVKAVGFADRPWGVRLRAHDAEGRLAIDQILQPRAHK